VFDLPCRREGDWRLDAVKFGIGSGPLIGVLGDGDEPRVSSLLNEHGKDAASRCVCPWIFSSVPVDAPGPVEYREVGTNEMNGGIEHQNKCRFSDEVTVLVKGIRLIETLAVDAIRNHTEKIDATSLQRLSTPPLLSMTESHSASDTSP
jgi:hypothetical protein